MASQTGTVTDYRNFMDVLVTFITANGWVADRNTTVTVGTGGLGVDGTNNKELIVHSDAGGGRNVYFGISSFQDSGVGYFNLQLRGFTGYNAANSFATQPGISPNTYVPLQNSSMTYWAFVNARRVCAIIKTGTSYQFMYCGFIDTFATSEPNEYPYPLCIFGCTYLQTTLFNSNALHYASSSHPGSNSASTTTNATHSPGYLRLTDGAWYGIKNFQGTTFESSLVSNVVNVWPMSYYDTANFATADLYNTFENFTILFLSNTQGGTPNANLLKTENAAADNIVPMWPLTLHMKSPSQQVIGELHNVYWCSGGDGTTAEDTVIDGADTFRIFQNIHRTDNWMFMAVKDE